MPQIINNLTDSFKNKTKDFITSKEQQESSQKSNLPKTYIQWQAPEYEYFKKSKKWFAVSGAIGLLVLGWAILTKNILFALIIMLGYFSLVVHGLRKPRNILVSLTSEGIKIDRTFYEFDKFKSFYIFDRAPDIKELSLKSKKAIMPFIKLPLSEEDAIRVKKFLAKYLPEKKHEEPLIDNMAKLLKF